MLARPQACPKLALWRLTSPAFDGSGYGRAFSATTSAKLFKQLGLVVPSNDDGVVDLDAYERALTKALELPAEQLQKAARATYEQQYAKAPPTFTRTSLP
jgi:hypothetical protein